MDELLDLVNENDEVFGEVGKETANSNPKLIHREILIYVFDDEKRLLMQQRSFKKKVYPGAWAETCSGHVAKSELPIEAAHRELKEELGFDTELEFVGKRLIKLPNETHFAYSYRGRYRGEKIMFQREEVEAVKFVGREEFRLIWGEDDEYTRSEADWIESVWI